MYISRTTDKIINLIRHSMTDNLMIDRSRFLVNKNKIFIISKGILITNKEILTINKEIQIIPIMGK